MNYFIHILIGLVIVIHKCSCFLYTCVKMEFQQKQCLHANKYLKKKLCIHNNS